MIKFGSQVDVIIPDADETEVLVQPGRSCCRLVFR